jgi:hypothetical protein
MDSSRIAQAIKKWLIDKADNDSMPLDMNEISVSEIRSVIEDSLKEETQPVSGSLTEKELWKLIEGANWQSDNDYERIATLFKSYPKEVYEQLQNFFGEKSDALRLKFNEAWLGDPGIGVSDDGWSDLTSEVVGRGEKFYNGITVKKLQKMAKELDYTESFAYCFS